MLPILISVSVAPVSYCFCASAPLLVNAAIARAAEKAPNRKWIAGISTSLVSVECVNFFDWERFSAPRRIQYLPQEPFNTKPPATASQRASFIRTAIGSRTRQLAPPSTPPPATTSPTPSHSPPFTPPTTP